MCPNISRGSSGHRAHQHLNPIENAWALVAKRVVAKQASLRQPKTLEELKHAVRGAWTEVMTEEYCTTLADSMDARLRNATEAAWWSHWLLAMDSLPPSLVFALRCWVKNNTL